MSQYHDIIREQATMKIVAVVVFSFMTFLVASTIVHWTANKEGYARAQCWRYGADYLTYYEPEVIGPGGKKKHLFAVCTVLDSPAPEAPKSPVGASVIFVKVW